MSFYENDDSHRERHDDAYSGKSPVPDDQYLSTRIPTADPLTAHQEIFTSSPQVTAYVEYGSGSVPMSNTDGYRFSLVDGRVTNLQEFDDGRWKNERISRKESWSFDGTNLVKTETKRGQVKTSTFSDGDGDGIFTRTGRDSITGTRVDRTYDDSSPSTDDGYRFSLVNGQVTNLQEFDDGRWKNERISSNETWSFDGTNLIQQETKRYGIEVSTYGDANGDGVFTKVSEIYNPTALGTSNLGF